MWDSNSPLQLLNSMPEKLEDEHLEKLQLLFEADKYKNQLINGVDLCGIYAPFCFGCNKEGKYPCAVAYVNSKKEEGMNVEIAASDEPLEESFEEQPSLSADPVEEKADDAITDEKDDNNRQAKRDENNREAEKQRIRIAIARKKIL